MKKQEEECEYHQILNQKKHDMVTNHFIDSFNQQLDTKYASVTVSKVFGQYVHTRWFMYHLNTNNGDKITALMQVYQFQQKNIHAFVDYVYTGHMKPLTAQKKLIQMQNWPSCGAFGRSSSCDIDQAQRKISSHLSEINEKLQLEQQDYKIVRCWSQMVQGVNYFMHVISPSGKKASIGMYVPFDDQDFQDEEEIKPAERPRHQNEQLGQSYEQLRFQITICSKGHVNYQ